MKKILQKEAREAGVLRQKAKEVPAREITTPKIKKILREMISALRSQDDGVAIAAPQIGYPLRIFVVSGKIFSEKEAGPGPASRGEAIEQKEKTKNSKDLIFINPKISKLSREKEWVPEGCLSVRWLYGKAFRSKKATVAAYDEKGKKFERGGSGLLAQIFQHETDHLNGILFIDHAKDIKEEPPQTD
jgi:peptide deformylase